MEEQKKGRPQIYNGEMSGLARRMEQRRHAGKMEGSAQKTSGTAEDEPKKTATAGNGQKKARPRQWSPDPAKGRRREQENARKLQTLYLALGVLIVLLLAAIIYEIVLGHGIQQTGQERMAARNAQQKVIDVYPAEDEGADSSGDGTVQEDGQNGADSDNGKEADADRNAGGTDADGAGGTDTDGNVDGSGKAGAGVLEQAQLKAAQYDYDGAIVLLQGADGYGENADWQKAVQEFEEQKTACVAYPASEVTHIFFHTLIHDASKAFDGDQYEGGYNQYMVTEYEFNSIIQQMYERGYVMIFLDEFVNRGEDNGAYAAHDIMLPPGKIPFVLSQDDVSYYHYMDGDGFASRLIVDENGDVKNEYIEDDGSVSVGDYDMVPLIDRFVEQHPDFSYHGQKGYVALTGYEGILGYRTDEVYKTKEAARVTIQQQQFFDSYPGGFDEAAFEQECEGARKVAEAMKANGWKFASHTWGHQNMSETNGISWDGFVRDTDRWETWVEPLIGETDILIYAFGGDIRGAETYAGDRFNYLKEAGFDYFCGVDSTKYWLQIGDDYVRQSRRNVDGYRMYYNPDMLSDLFDVEKAWDPLRPSTVPAI